MNQSLNKKWYQKPWWLAGIGIIIIFGIISYFIIQNSKSSNLLTSSTIAGIETQKISPTTTENPTSTTTTSTSTTTKIAKNTNSEQSSPTTTSSIVQNSTNQEQSSTSTNNQDNSNPPPSQEDNSSEIKVSFIWPAQGTVTATFGVSTPFQTFHPGIDIANVIGTPVVASAAGTVSTVNSLSYGYGNYVVITHNDAWQTLYGQLSSFVVASGQHVEQGQVIGYIGMTGWTTGPHLHFEIRYNGVPVDPLQFLP